MSRPRGGGRGRGRGGNLQSQQNHQNANHGVNRHGNPRGRSNDGGIPRGPSNDHGNLRGQPNSRGSQRGQYNNNGNSQGQFNNNGTGRTLYHCNNCGSNPSHATAQCRNQNGGSQNGNGSNGNFFNGNGFNRNGSNNNSANSANRQNRNNNPQIGKIQKLTCLRCGYLGHDDRYCTAKELPEEDWCACGSEYHRTHQCQWGGDQYARQQARDSSRGLICQWCKNDSDGMHVFNDCKQVLRFRNELRSNIHREYEGFQWCWHCSSEEHKTRACNRESANIGRSAWEARINAIIDRWTRIDPHSLAAQQLNSFEDTTMGGSGGPEWRTPVAAAFSWCVHCNDFGHFSNQYDTCDMAEYQRKCPSRYKTETSLRPYVPPTDGVMVSYTNSTSGAFNGNGREYIHSSCIMANCRGLLRFPKGDHFGAGAVLCPVCRAPNPHPNNRESGWMQLMTTALLTSLNPHRAFTRQQLSKLEADPYRGLDKRPSSLLPKSLAVTKWPDQQPRYIDMNAWIPTIDAPLFDRDIDIFNGPGNFQSYFPPFLIQLSEDQMAQQEDHNLLINRAGRMGLDLCCQRCGRWCVILDDENDVVMTGTHAPNTSGCGVGRFEWRGTSRKENCACMGLYHRAPDYVWKSWSPTALALGQF